MCCLPPFRTERLRLVVSDLSSLRTTHAPCVTVVCPRVWSLAEEPTASLTQFSPRPCATASKLTPPVDARPAQGKAASLTRPPIRSDVKVKLDIGLADG